MEKPVAKPEPKPKGPPKPKYTRKTKATGEHITQDWQPPSPIGRQLAFPSNMLDIFAKARDEIATGKARGKIGKSGYRPRKTT